MRISRAQIAGIVATIGFALAALATAATSVMDLARGGTGFI